MAQQNNQPRSTSGAVVTVASKLPNGLILRCHRMVDQDEPLFGGGFKTVKKAEQLPGEIFINGNAHPQNAGPRCQIIGGFALTTGVSKEFWDLWLSQSKGSDMVRNNLIFAHEHAANTAAEAKEKKSARSGLERLDPNNLPNSVGKIKTADDAPKEMRDRIDEASQQAAA